jgi:hypothetical protein
LATLEEEGSGRRADVWATLSLHASPASETLRRTPASRLCSLTNTTRIHRYCLQCRRNLPSLEPHRHPLDHAHLVRQRRARPPRRLSRHYTTPTWTTPQNVSS